MGKFIDLTGQRFGRLVAITLSPKGNCSHMRWLCVCDCGNKIIAQSGNLKSHHTQSCGCLIMDGNNTRHGHSKKTKVSKTYKSWQNMKRRCTNPENNRYKQYNTKGIVICERWMNSFENFLEDMGERPGSGYSIDRKENDKGYFKLNYRWATTKEQARNTSRNHLITHNGKTQCISAWAEEYSICPYVLRTRIKLGWSMEKALTTPVKKYKKRKNNG